MGKDIMKIMKFNEDLTMNSRITLVLRGIVIFSISCLIFTGINGDRLPLIVKLIFSYETQLSVYPLVLVSFFYFFYKALHKSLSDYKYLLYFFIAYFIINFVIILHGILVFPYFEFTNGASLPNADMFVYSIGSSLFPFLSNKSVFILAFVAKSSVTMISSFLSSYFVGYSLFLFYKDSHANFLNDITIGICLSIGIIGIYEIFEIAYLLGFKWGENILKVINPHLYSIASNHGWWPPLLWGDKVVRSVFQEPSFFAYWGALAVPILLYNTHRNKGKYFYIPFSFVLFLLFATYSRTAIALVIGELCIYFILELLFLKKKSLLSILAICLLTVASFLVANIFIGYCENNTNSKVIQNSLATMDDHELISISKDYVANTLGTLTTLDARSNNSRYGLTEAYIKVGLQHPIFGVAAQLGGYYILDALPPYVENNGEVQGWKACQHEVGPLINAFPTLNFYAADFAYKGIVGVVLDLLPLLLLCILVFVRIIRVKGSREFGVYVLSSFAVVLAFGLSGNLTINYFIWIIMAVGLFVINNREC